MFAQENNLYAEIAFWQEMIESQSDRCSTAALERMQQALALAERKLLLLEPGPKGLTEVVVSKAPQPTTFRKDH